MRQGLIALLAPLLLALAGCATLPAASPGSEPLVGPGPGSASAPGSTRAESGGAESGAESPFRLEGKSCVLGGGHSVHHSSIAPLVVPEPWKVADIWDDVGPQLIYPEQPYQGPPQKGETWGNWHVTVRCGAWNNEDGDLPADLVFGFVATRVEAPSWDDGMAARHYILNVLGISDKHTAEHFSDAGFHTTLSTGKIEYPTPTTFHHVLDTADHGVYESLYSVKEAGEAPQGIVRLWWQYENENHTFSPRALDLAMAGGKHLWAERNGYFSHLRTRDHAPLPGAAGPIAGLNWEGFDMRIAFGPTPEVFLPKAYAHL